MPTHERGRICTSEATIVVGLPYRYPPSPHQNSEFKGPNSNRYLKRDPNLGKLRHLYADHDDFACKAKVAACDNVVFSNAHKCLTRTCWCSVPFELRQASCQETESL